MSNQKPNTDTFLVLDKLATTLTGPRIHSYVGQDGEEHDILFKPKERAEVPRAFAMKLAAIDSFDVQDKAGREVKITAQSKTLAAVTLAPDELIARYDELTDKALYVRVREIAGVEPKDADRDEMIVWLIENGRSSNTPGGRASDEEVLQTALTDPE